MRRHLIKRYVVCLLLLSVTFVLGCRQLTHEEQVEKLRGEYTAKLNEGGFFVRDVPVEEEMAPGDEPIAEADGSEAEEGEVMEPPTRQEVLLDIIVQHDSNERLPGVTVDISMVDGSQNEKGHWLLWVETADLPKANQKQVTKILEDVGYQEGYGFHVEIRRPVPVEERGDYREFSP